MDRQSKWIWIMIVLLLIGEAVLFTLYGINAGMGGCTMKQMHNMMQSQDGNTSPPQQNMDAMPNQQRPMRPRMKMQSTQ